MHAVSDLFPLLSATGNNDNLPSFFALSDNAGSTLEELGGGLGGELGGSLEDDEEVAMGQTEDKGKVTLDNINEDEFKAAMAAAGGIGLGNFIYHRPPM